MLDEELFFRSTMRKTNANETSFSDQKKIQNIWSLIAISTDTKIELLMHQ